MSSKTLSHMYLHLILCVSILRKERCDAQTPTTYTYAKCSGKGLNPSTDSILGNSTVRSVVACLKDCAKQQDCQSTEVRQSRPDSMRCTFSTFFDTCDTLVPTAENCSVFVLTGMLCKNGGKIMKESRKCKCPDGYKGDWCEIKTG